MIGQQGIDMCSRGQNQGGGMTLDAGMIWGAKRWDMESRAGAMQVLEGVPSLLSFPLAYNVGRESKSGAGTKQTCSF